MDLQTSTKSNFTPPGYASTMNSESPHQRKFYYLHSKLTILNRFYDSSMEFFALKKLLHTKNLEEAEFMKWFKDREHAYHDAVLKAWGVTISDWSAWCDLFFRYLVDW